MFAKPYALIIRKRYCSININTRSSVFTAPYNNTDRLVGSIKLIGVYKLLEGYKGYVVIDGYAGYDELVDQGIKIQRCFAHIRRKFYNIVKVLPDELKKVSAVNEMARRNVLFAKSENGASISGRLFIIIQTAKANGLIVDKYIEYVIDHINKTPVEDLLPWSEKLPQELFIKQFVK